MLVVFEIDDDVLRPEAAKLLAERETLWVFCKNYRVLGNWRIEGETPETIALIAPPPPEPPVKLVPPPTKRTMQRKKLQNGPVPEG